MAMPYAQPQPMPYAHTLPTALPMAHPMAHPMAVPLVAGQCHHTSRAGVDMGPSYTEPAYAPSASHVHIPMGLAVAEASEVEAQAQAQAQAGVGAGAEKGGQRTTSSVHNFCSGCGARNEGCAFCPQCGASLTA
jgi:hypothetical protein